MDGQLVDVEGRGEDRLQIFGQRERLALVADALADDRELVAAHPGGVTAPAHRGGQPLGHLFQNSVAGRMSVNIVDRLESVEI
jgi:hypothetical protein